MSTHPVARAIRVLDAISLWSGKITAWLIVPLILALTYEVVARYFFDAPTIWAYDVTFMIYGARVPSEAAKVGATIEDMPAAAAGSRHLQRVRQAREGSD